MSISSVMGNLFGQAPVQQQQQTPANIPANAGNMPAATAGTALDRKSVV